MKTERLAFILLAAAALVTAGPAGAQPLPASTEACVRDGTYFNSDYIEFNTGYLMVKYGSGSSGKAYFQFDFTGQNPNTNNALTLSFTTASNSQRQHLQVWALDQAYPGLANNIVWASAQANETNSNSMLTNGAYTASLLTHMLSASGGNLTVNVAVPAPWGSYLIDNHLVLVLTATNDAANGSNGLRVKTNTTALAFQTAFGAPPAIGPIPNIKVNANQASPTNTFTVADPEDGPDSLYPFAASSNEQVVPAANVFFEGAGANRRVYVIGAASGVADITVSVMDSSGNTGQRTFTVTVLPANFAPVMSALPPTNTLVNSAVTVPVTIGDAETPAKDLTLSGSIAPYSANLLASLSFGTDASGTNRTVTITPIAGADGVGVVTLTLSDTNDNTTTASFPVMVLPAANVVFNEHFDYPDGDKLFESSGGLWARRNSSAQNVNLLTGASQQAYLRPKGNADDGAARLVGAPYVVGSHAVLYTSCKVTWVDNGAGDILVTNSNGAFVHLANNASATSPQAARIGTATNAMGADFFRVALVDYQDNYQAYPNLDVPMPAGAVSQTHTLLVRYDVDTARSTLWVDSSSEAAPSVSSVDDLTPNAISYVGLRQDVGFGYAYVDDLKVVLVTKPGITALLPAGGNVTVSFAAGLSDVPGAFILESAVTPAGPYSSLNATITSPEPGKFQATVPASLDQSYYRIKRQPLTF